MSREAAIAKIDSLTAALQAQLRMLNALRAVVSEMDNVVTAEEFEAAAKETLN